MKSPFNIFVTGVGGQGVVTLVNTFRIICERNKLHSTGSVIKGGAQRLGTVSASLRIFDGSCSDYRDHSVEIPDGRLDLMIGLEPWECLRARRLFSKDTNVLLNLDEVPLLVARTRRLSIKNPVTELDKLGVTIQADHYTRKAIDEHDNKKMMNYEMGMDAIRMAIPAFSIKQYNQCFKELIADV